MWYGRIRDINIWKEDSRSNTQLAKSRQKAVQTVDGEIVFYMGAQLMDVDIDMLSLSVRAHNCLKRAGWNTIGQIITNIESTQDLLRVRNLGKTSADEIIRKLVDYQERLLTAQDRTIIIRRASESKLAAQVQLTDNRGIEDLNLSARSYNCLKRAGYNTVEELRRAIRGGMDLKSIRNLGVQSEEEIVAALACAV